MVTVGGEKGSTSKKRGLFYHFRSQGWDEPASLPTLPIHMNSAVMHIVPSR